jgi:ABC-type dipeptide/oligopeptide/nickel transport system permease subunit
LPFALSSSAPNRPARYEDGSLQAILLPPTWTGYTDGAVDVAQAIAQDPGRDMGSIAVELGIASPDDPAPRVPISLERYSRYTLERAQEKIEQGVRDELGLRPTEDIPAESKPAPPTRAELEAAAPTILLGTDKLGRSLLVRSLAGGGVSIGIGLAAALISVTIGTLYGATAGYMGGRVDASLMRIVDILYGLPYILLVVLLAVAGDAVIDNLETSVARDAIVARTAWQVDEAAAQASGASRAAAVDAIEGVAPTDPDDAERVAQAEEATRALREAAQGALVDGSVSTRRFVEMGVRETGSGGFADPVILALLDGDGEARAGVLEAALANKDLPKGKIAEGWLRFLDVAVLFIAIGGVSWLTMARVIRGQVLSLKAQPFMEAARAMGVPVRRQFVVHLLPNLLGPIIVYATLTVPQAILQESFLSFLGIGVKAPVPSWGNLAADGLTELNTITPNWWLLLFPCLLLGITLLALNFVGEGLREAFDPKRARK